MKEHADAQTLRGDRPHREIDRERERERERHTHTHTHTQVIKEHVAHPDFEGRSSLKVTLPVLVPSYKTRYAALPVANGADAATAFERLSSHELAEDEKEALRRDLLEYCKLDTLAMVELHSALHALVVDGRG